MMFLWSSGCHVSGSALSDNDDRSEVNSSVMETEDLGDEDDAQKLLELAGRFSCCHSYPERSVAYIGFDNNCCLALFQRSMGLISP